MSRPSIPVLMNLGDKSAQGDPSTHKRLPAKSFLLVHRRPIAQANIPGPLPRSWP